ncbi:alpha/beta hydrolase [Paenalkalicoccus suaedae]|uniref:Alpha/beta hydrolase n=2 Tax=Paenalkalicoccus suaedae TaxID=2592382 RepID=A0A859FK39_9BACI|nr:alpha/beta hydrolase [Paenalkalicoccus suaedae]
MLAHGFGTDQQVWHLIVPHLKENYRLVLFDYVGSGHSDKQAYNEARYGELDGYAQDIIDIADELDLADFILIGHSISSMIGLLVTIKRPELIRDLIMVGPSPIYIANEDIPNLFKENEIEALIEMMERNFSEWTKTLAPIASSNPDRPELSEDFEKRLLHNDAKIIKKFAEVTFYIDLRQELSIPTTPTLIFQTKEDNISPIESGEFVHGNMQNSTLIIMEAKGHNPHLSAPEELLTGINNYLQERNEGK